MSTIQLGTTQINREVQVTCALGADALLFRRMQATEGLSELPDYQIELLSEQAELRMSDLLGTVLTVSVALSNDEQRHFNGFVTRFAYLGRLGRFARYQATARPWLWFLTRSADCRIFQEKSVVDIIKLVFEDYLVADFEFKISGTYKPRPYCVQYRETDLNFITRLMEENGLYYYFRSVLGRHVMVITDSYGGHDRISGYERIRFESTNKSAVRGREIIYDWLLSGEVLPGACALNAYDFEKSSSSLAGRLQVRSAIGAAHAHADYELYDFPGKYVENAAGEDLAKVRIEALHTRCERVSAGTQARGIFPGGLFELVEHPRGDQNREYLVVEASYRLVSAAYEAVASADPEPLIDCTLSLIASQQAYRAECRARKPIVHGPQTAIVTGPGGEEIYTDKYGRIKVQFHWDREGHSDEKSSCWIRVAQGWAGKAWGMMVLPRIGMEVIVTFLEGDPDQPLVTGCVYNSDAMPPYPLPDNRTRSTIKSNSTRESGGFNEIRFEDLHKKEEIFVQAEKDFNRVVKNNDTLKVGFEKKDPGDQSIGIHNDQTLDVGGHQKITVGKTCVIEATQSIELKVGGSSIKLEPAKITVKSAEIAAEADLLMKLKAGTVVTIEGALVKIN